MSGILTFFVKNLPSIVLLVTFRIKTQLAFKLRVQIHTVVKCSFSRGFWSKRTGLEKTLLAVVGICGMAMIAAGAVIAMQQQNTG